MKIKNFLVSLVFCLTLFFVSAESTLNVNINVEEFFGVGEEIYFNYSIVANEDVNVSYFGEVVCEGSYELLVDLEEISLKKDVELEDSYVYGIIDEDVGSVDCVASIMVVGYDSVVYYVEEGFNVVSDYGVFDDFSFWFCGDSSCLDRSSVFVVGDGVWFGWGGEGIEDVVLTLVLPDGSERVVDGTGGSLFLGEVGGVGSYSVEFVVSGEGYVDLVGVGEFGVVEGEVVVEDFEFGEVVDDSYDDVYDEVEIVEDSINDDSKGFFNSSSDGFFKSSSDGFFKSSSDGFFEDSGSDWLIIIMVIILVLFLILFLIWLIWNSR